VEIDTEGAVVSAVERRGFGAASVGVVAARASGTATATEARARRGVRTGSVLHVHVGTRGDHAVTVGGDTSIVG
jgi:hypothetical protein